MITSKADEIPLGHTIMISKDNEIRKLMESVAPIKVHQYKSYYMKYIEWCEQKELLSFESNLSIPYENVPLLPQLVHLFLLECVIKWPIVASDVNELQIYIESFRFLKKLCDIHSEVAPNSEFDDYITDVLELHRRWDSLLKDESQSSQLNKMATLSINMWNSNTQELSDKYFKTSMEKLRFLTDYHFYTLLNWPYKERSKLKLSHLKVHNVENDENSLNAYRLIVINDDGAVQGTVIPHDCPLICPITTLAAYLYLRFYGVKPIYRGDGFPELTKDFDLPLIRGKSLKDYPREETLGNYYSSAFKYCSLEYKRRVYLHGSSDEKNGVKNIRYPDTSNPAYKEFLTDYPNNEEMKFDRLFPAHIPLDYERIFNYSNYDGVQDGLTIPEIMELPPNDLLVQVFPEIEKYKRESYNILTTKSKEFLKVLEVLRNVLVINLPWIYRYFPDHEIFSDQTSIFQNSDFVSYFNERIALISNNDSTIDINSIPPPLRNIPGYHTGLIENNIMLQYLVEPNFKAGVKSDSIPSVHDSIYNIPVTGNEGQSSSVALAPPITNNSGWKKEVFKLVQFQTLSNFNPMIDTFKKVFEKLDMKRSTREFIINKFETLTKYVNARLNSVTSEEITSYFDDILEKKNGLRYINKESNSVDKLISGRDVVDNLKRKKQKQKRRFKLLSVDDSSSGTDDANEDSVNDSSTESDSSTDDLHEEENAMQQQISSMIDEIVTKKLSTLFDVKFEQMEMKLESLVKNTVSEKFNHYIAQESKKRSYEGDFEIDNTKKIRKSIDDGIKEKFNDKVNTSSTGAEEEHFVFRMADTLDSIDEIIQEWYTPDPKQGNMCVHSMNKKYKSKWRTGFEKIYRERKPIVDFFIYLVNMEKLSRSKALSICWELKSQNNFTVSELSAYLKSWKEKNNSTFVGLLNQIQHT